MQHGGQDMDWQDEATPGRRGEGSATPGGAPARTPPSAPLPMRPRQLVFMHWLTVLFLLCGVSLIIIRSQVDARALRQWLLEGHRHFGLLVLILFFVRVALRIRLGRLPVEGHPAWPLRFAAAATHTALYALLLVQPLLGWALSNSENKPVHFFGITLPALVASDEDLADRLGLWHAAGAWLLLALVSLHVAASLWHHYILKDRVLRMMLPRRWS